MTETETSPLAEAHQAIGAYSCSFSRVEHELGESIKAVYGLQNNEASDAIVAALGDFARKARLVWAASKGAKNVDGSEAAAEWKDKVEATIKRVFSCNDDRVLLAHSLLQPNADGSVDFVRLKVDRGKVTGRDGVKWSREDFRSKIQQLDKLAEELRSLNGELQKFKYTITNLGWMTSNSNFEPMMSPRGVPAALLMAIANQPPVPPLPPAEDSK
jgi:hypothetical protein